MIPVPADNLKDLGAAALQPVSPNGRASYSGSGRAWDLDTWIPDHGLIVKIEKPGSGGGRRMVLGACPFNTDHSDGSAVITESGEGQIGFKCHHQSCEGKHWRDVRELLEPGAYDRKGVGSFGRNGHHLEKPLSAFANTDLGNAERLVALHGEDLRYSYELGQWFVWDDRRWGQNHDGEIYRRASETIRTMYFEAGRLEKEAGDMPDETERMKLAGVAEALSQWARKSEGKARAESMISWAQSREGIPVLMTQLDVDPWLLNVNDGTIDLRTGNLRHHDRADLITKLAPTDYDPNAGFQLWDDFLDRVLPDLDQQRFVQRASGYSTTGLSTEEKLFFAYGPTSTGKSTFLQAVKSTLGDYAATSDFATFLHRDRDNGAPRNDIARLAGKRFVVSIEVEEGQKLAESLMQTLTGGETVTARFLYRESFEFVPTFTLWLAANNRPRVRGDNDANWRRIVQVPFNTQIPESERDPGVKVALSDPSIADQRFCAGS